METELWPNLFARVRAPRRAAGARQRAVVGEIGGALSALRQPVSRDLLGQFADCGADPRGCRTLRRHRCAECTRTHVDRQYQVRPGVECGGSVRGTRAARLARRRAARLDRGQHARRRGGAGAGGAPGNCVRARPNALLLLAPRHPDRFDAVADLAEIVRAGASRAGAAASMPDARRRRWCWWIPWANWRRCTRRRMWPSSAAAWCRIGGHNLARAGGLRLAGAHGPVVFQRQGHCAAIARCKGPRCRWPMRGSWRPRVAQLLADPAQRQRMGAVGRHMVEANRGSVARAARAH